MDETSNGGVLVGAGRAIGYTLGKLAAKVGLNSPDAVEPKPRTHKRRPARAKRAAAKKPAGRATGTSRARPARRRKSA